MRLLYLGGIFPAEFSLFKEAQANPNLEVIFGQSPNISFLEYEQQVNPVNIPNRGVIDNLREYFKPDLTIFRGWVPLEHYILPNELLWHQEIYVTLDDGSRPHNYTPPKICNKVAYQSLPMAKANNQYWLPYCASEHWGLIPNTIRDIPVMMATNLSDPSTGGAIKRRSMDILIKPIIEWNPELAYVCSYGDRIWKVPYVAQCRKPTFKFLEMPQMLSRVKIYVSPTSIWYDEGCVSYKIYEAMACGCLVLTNNYVGMEAVFGKDGENLIYAATPEESLDKVRYYLDHDAEREQLSERGRQFILREYGWEKHLARLFQETR